MRLHYLQHVPFENPGSIITWAIENNHTLTKTAVYLDEKFPNQEDFDWLIIMGGPMNIYEEEKYPWLRTEKLFIKDSIKDNKIVIGLCLGGQLIADVMGGKVSKNLYHEIGWYCVDFSDKARLSPLFSFFPKEVMVFEWHEDTFSILPEGAESIAENQICLNQAFVYKKRVFGFQFHLENTFAIINDLVKNCYQDTNSGPYIQSVAELLGHPEYIEQDNCWMNQFLYQLEKMAQEEIM
jgi:GMP synthase-like glutamine amidotransferase